MLSSQLVPDEGTRALGGAYQSEIAADIVRGIEPYGRSAVVGPHPGGEPGGKTGQLATESFGSVRSHGWIGPVASYNLRNLLTQQQNAIKKMAKPTILFGVILIVLGLLGYFGTKPAPAVPADGAAEVAVDGEPAAAGERSLTGLIPLIPGVLLLICGAMALNEKNLKHAMHGAAMVGLLGALAGLGRGIMVLVRGGDYNMRAVTFSLFMGAICAAFMVMCIRSFIATRKRREAAAAGS